MSKKAYPCIGGPLNGKHAITEDFSEGPCHYEWPQKDGTWAKSYMDRIPGEKPRKIVTGPGGMYAQYKDVYNSYNAAGRYRAKGAASMVFIHISLLKPTISPGKR